MWEKYSEKAELEMLLIQEQLLNQKSINLKKSKERERDNTKKKWSKFTLKSLTGPYSSKEKAKKETVTKVDKFNIRRLIIKQETCNQEEANANRKKEVT